MNSAVGPEPEAYVFASERGKPRMNLKGKWYARADSNGRPFAPEAKNINHLRG